MSGAGEAAGRSGEATPGPTPVLPARVSVTHLLLLLAIPGMALVDSAIGLVGKGQDIPGLFLSPGELVRGLLAVAGMFALVSPGRRVMRVRIYVGLLVGLVVITLTTAALRGEPLPYLLFDIQQAGRVLFGPLFVVVLALLFLRYGVRAWMVASAVAWYGAVAGGLILVVRALGTGLPTYGSYSEAFAGFFAAPNDTGLAMIISLVSSSYLFVRDRSPLYGTLAAITIAGLLILGTRAALIGSFAAPAAIVVLTARRTLSRRRWLTSLVIVVALAASLIAAGLYQRARIERDTYQTGRLANLVSPEFSRVLLFARAWDYVQDRPGYQHLVGEGAAGYRRGDADELTDENDLLAEVDWMDLFGAYGLVFTLALYGFYLWLAGRARVFSRAADGDPYLVRVVWLSLFLYLAHASIAGHGISSPTPSGVVAPLLALAAVMDSRKDTEPSVSESSGT